MIRPPRLRAGARVAVVAPAGPVPRDAFAAGAAILGARYTLVHDERVFAREGYLAGGDDARAAELGRALGDPSVEAVFCARGGYGLLRILPRLDAAAFARAPKLLVGFSDVTALHAWAWRAGVASLHAPVVTQLGHLPAGDAAALFDACESTSPPPPLTGLRAIDGGSGRGAVEGPLVGGNLEVLTRLVGTPWAPALDGAVLLLEGSASAPTASIASSRSSASRARSTASPASSSATSSAASRRTAAPPTPRRCSPSASAPRHPRRRRRAGRPRRAQPRPAPWRARAPRRRRRHPRVPRGGGYVVLRTRLNERWDRR